MSCLSCYPASVASSVGDGENTASLDERAFHKLHQRPSHSNTVRLPDLQTGSIGTIEAVGSEDINPAMINSITGLGSFSDEPTVDTIDLVRRRHLEQNYRRPYSSNGNQEGDGCVSCSISIPQNLSSRLPPGAPGSPRQDGVGRNGSPVLRSRESVHACGTQHWDSEDEDYTQLLKSSPQSSTSSASASSCHTHTLTYMSTSKPADAEIYALLQKACVRTLSCEQLPRGLTSGSLSFCDPLAGYTVAYKFRLRDPHARGSHRSYALLALAGHDAGRAYKATPLIWAFFERIAADITTSAANRAAQEKLVAENSDGQSCIIPVSSFLTGRTMDPDGYPRRNGTASVRAKGLAEIVGNESFFGAIHQEFVKLLQELGKQFGGMKIEAPIVDSGLSSSLRGGRQH